MVVCLFSLIPHPTSEGALERGITQARTITKIIFGSHDYHTLKASDIVTAFAGDSRLKFVSEHDMHNETVGGLAVLHQLIPSKSTLTRYFTQCLLC